MPFKLPLARLPRRVVFLRATLLIATGLGLIASTPAWLNQRSFPLIPIAPGFPILPSLAAQILFGSMLAALMLSLWSYRSGIVAFLLLSTLAFCQDQNRGQPWFYMYSVMLLLSLAPGPVALAACRLALSAIYFWSGIQKLNPRFFAVVPGWFVAPALKWHLPAAAVDAAKAAVAAAPFIELVLAILFWVPRCRRVAIIAVLILHGVSLIFLGPLGYNYNWVVWPWNMAMIALAWTLFSRSKLLREAAIETPKPAVASRPQAKRKREVEPADSPEPSAIPPFRETVTLVRTSPASFIVLLLFSLLPILSFAGWWNSYFSFSLYAENSAHANIFITQTFAERLPPALRKYVQPFSQPYDPQHQGPLILAFDPWCYEELHVPPVPEVSNFKGIFHHLQIYAKNPAELRMIIGPRVGPVIFLEDDRIELLRRK